MSSGINDVQKELLSRNLPDFMLLNGEKISSMEQWEEKRKEMQHILCQELYGFMPFREAKVSGRIVKEQENGYGGKALIHTVNLEVSTSVGFCSFPFQLTIPKDVEKPPVFIHLSGNPVDTMAEELSDNGYAVASVYYQDIMPDRPEAELEGIARIIEKVPYIGWGKIAMWAYGISRITDYLMTRDDLDTGRIAIVGHSRLGKTTLLCGALDNRYSLIISAQSGAGGAALFRGKIGEKVENLSKHWFCQNVSKYSYHPEMLPFDQHFLLALAAPKRVYISSAVLDEWADPKSEFLSCVAASPAYELMGLEGLVYEDYPKCGELLHDGNIAYHMRQGTHALIRQDWHYFMKYRERFHV